MRFSVIFEENLPEAANGFFREPALIYVILFASKDPCAIQALTSIKAPKVIIPGIDGVKALLIEAGIPGEQIVDKVSAALARIEAEARLLRNASGIEYEALRKLAQNVADELLGVAFSKVQRPFFPLDVNRGHIRQLLGEYRSDFWNYKEEEQLEQRPAAQVELFNAVIGISHAIAQGSGEDRGNGVSFPTAILAFPSQSPVVKQLLNSFAKHSGKRSSVLKTIADLLFSEQNTQTFVPDLPQKHIDTNSLSSAWKIAGSELAAYTHFFDDMASLHGSFELSPYLRAPLKGKSLSQHHSFFSPKVFPTNPRERVVLRKLQAFSKVMTESIDTRMMSALGSYPGAILGLSDLPIEWLDNEGVPLCFTHDVCRIPETLPTNMLSQFVRNQFSTFEIGSDILSHTLVICGAPLGDPIERAFSRLKEFWTERNAPWRWAHCTTLDQVYKAVWEYRPQFLIFDTHGRFTDNATGTELQFGAEFLDGVGVIERLPQVPLVMLSSCWGAPLYGCPNTIAHAFFEGGSFAVTTAMLPLGIIKGASLYSRVLNNLSFVTDKPIHNTWASFMSHTIRTSYFDDLKERVGSKFHDWILANDTYLAKRTDWQLQTMSPKLRKSAFKEAKNTVVEVFRAEIKGKVTEELDSERFIPDFMFYSTMGRADLIRFSGWDEKYSRLKYELPTISTLLSGTFRELNPTLMSVH